MFKYKKVALGGTFDHFHKGHQLFLLFAAELSEQLVIGITTDQMVKTKIKAEEIEDFDHRAEAVTAFVRSLPLKNKVDIVPLTDPYGPTLSNSSVEALVVTTDTVPGAISINAKRLEHGLSQLPVHIRELEPAEDGSSISSKRIRLGEISRKGKVYKTLIEKGIVLSEQQRQFFSRTQGELVTNPSPSSLTIVVGDTSLETFIANNWPYDFGIVDLIKERKSYSPPVLSPDQLSFVAQNAPGEISAEMVAAVSSGLENHQKHLLIKGEEDLAAVAAMLLAPLGASIYYGQPKQGLVESLVTEARKETFAEILSQK